MLLDMSGAGLSLVYSTLLLGAVIVGLGVLMYAAHCFLLVVEQTAAGNDAVYWPDELITDWFGKVFYLAWLAGVWLLPPWLLVQAFAPQLLSEHPVTAAVLAAGLLWLMYPITLLSALSVSPWVVFRPLLLIQLARRPLAGLAFYLLTAVLLAGCGLLAAMALGPGPGWLLPIAAAGVAATVLIYARLLGRLAWLLSALPAAEPELPRESEELPETQPEPTVAPTPLAEAPPAEALEGYGLAGEEPRMPRPSSLVEAMIGLHEPAEAPSQLPRGEEIRAQARERRAVPRPPPPAWPLVSGIWTFPWYATSLKAWGWLMLGSLMVGGMVRALLHLES
jgi:hypothetical protein